MSVGEAPRLVRDPGAGYHVVKRAVDILVSSVGLILLGLPMLCIAVLIRLGSSGPALFRQTRVGLNGKQFQILKFRSMVQGAAALGSTNTYSGDPRVTAVGRLLRQTKLDELPQLMNVSRGEMTLVGPRPMPPPDVARYAERYRAVLAAKPGMTGLTQVRFADEEAVLAAVEEEDRDRYFYETVLPARLESELEYVASRSLWLDLKLVLRTPLVTVGSSIRLLTNRRPRRSAPPYLRRS